MTPDHVVIGELLEQCDGELREAATKYSACPGPPSSARAAFLPEIDELLDFRLMIMEAE